MTVRYPLFLSLHVIAILSYHVKFRTLRSGVGCFLSKTRPLGRIARNPP